MNSSDFRVPIASRIHIWWWWLWDRICVGNMWGLASGIAQWLQHFVTSWEHKSCEIHKYNGEFERFLGAYSYTNTHMMAVVVRQNACGVPVWTWFRGISPSLKDFGGSWEDKRSEMSSPAIYTSIWAVFGCLLLHEYTYDGGGCETEYVWGTCEDLLPA